MPGYEPVYAEVACDGGPFVGAPQFVGVVCGTLTVPENRDDPAGPEVVLPVQIFPSIDAPGVGVPLVYLSGGPGDAAIGGDWRNRVVARDRELIVVDQRGTGRSVPSLNCTEVDETGVTDYLAGATSQDRSAHEATALAVGRTRLEAQADLDQYDAPTVAADCIDLRAALGLDTWALFGVSYGTAVAQQIMRWDPQHVQAAILDSVVPPDSDDGRSNEPRKLRVHQVPGQRRTFRSSGNHRVVGVTARPLVGGIGRRNVLNGDRAPTVERTENYRASRPVLRGAPCGGRAKRVRKHFVSEERAAVGCLESTGVRLERRTHRVEVDRQPGHATVACDLHTGCRSKGIIGKRGRETQASHIGRAHLVTTGGRHDRRPSVRAYRRARVHDPGLAMSLGSEGRAAKLSLENAPSTAAHRRT